MGRAGEGRKDNGMQGQERGWEGKGDSPQRKFLDPLLQCYGNSISGRADPSYPFVGH